MKWQQGRQGTGYYKFKLWELSWPFGCDAYLLRYEVGSYLPPHKDPVHGKRHYRCNFLIRAPEKGGRFKCQNPIINWGWLIVFRSDIHTHSLSPVEIGQRLVLSIGWAI